MRGKYFLGKNVMIYTLAVSLLAGCGANKKVDYEPMDSQQGENGESQTQGEETSEWADGIPWKSELTVTMENGSKVAVVVDAKTEAKAKLPMSVVEVKEFSFDKDYRKQVLSAFFGESQVYYYSADPLGEDIKYVTKEQFAKSIDSLEAKLSDLTSGKYTEEDYPGLSLEIDSLRGTIASLRAQYEEAPADYVPISDYGANSYLGYIDKEPYTLVFDEWNYEGTPYGREIAITPLNNLLTGEFRDCMYVESTAMIGNWSFVSKNYPAVEEVENEAEISAQQARKEAEALLSRIGLSGSLYQGTLPCGWKGIDENGLIVPDKTVYNGYTVFFSVGEGGVGFEEYGSRIDYPYPGQTDKPKNYGRYYETNVSFRVTVTDRGVLECRICNPISVVKKTEAVKLLALENIEEILLRELKNHPDDILIDYKAGTKKVYYHTLSLIYFRMHSPREKGTYSYIPVWRLQKDEKDLGSPVLINAMDGSFIDWREEF